MARLPKRKKLADPAKVRKALSVCFSQLASEAKAQQLQKVKAPPIIEISLEQLQSFYKKISPSNVQHASKHLGMYKKKHHKLLDDLFKKYKARPECTVKEVDETALSASEAFEHAMSLVFRQEDSIDCSLSNFPVSDCGPF